MKPEIPFLDLQSLHSRYVNDMTAIAAELIGKAAFIGGQPVTEFEESFASYCEANHSVGCANGTDAIQLALEALGVGPGDEVITAANTFFATVEAIVHAGARPVLVDSDLKTWLIDPAAVEAAITTRTTAIVAVHLYGQPAPMEELRAIANRHGLALIEDAAQAHGAKINGKRVGGLGDASAFSFYPGKNLGACGDGGAVTTNRNDLADKVRVLSQHGQARKYHHEAMGYNSRLDTLQAAFLAIKLKHLDADNQKRRNAAARYTEQLSELGDGIVTPATRDGNEAVFHLYVVHVLDRDDLLDKLKTRGVNCAIHYPVPCHLQIPCKRMGYQEGEFPNAELNARHCLSLPMFPDISEEQIDRVCEAISEVLPSLTVPPLTRIARAA